MMTGVVRVASSRIASLDGLRGIAASMVIATHYLKGIERHSYAKAVAPYVQFGGTGVDLFFVLSGFLLAGILLDRRHTDTYYSRFYIRRACRIFPLYFALLLAVICLVPLVPFLAADKNFEWGSAKVWWFLVYVQNYGMGAIGSHMPPILGTTWSLAVEEQFYAVLPLTIRRLSTRALVVTAGIAWAGSFLLRLLIVQSAVWPPLAATTWSVSRLDPLAAGILAAILVRSNIRVSSRTLLLAAIFLLGGSLAASPWLTPLSECFSVAAVAAGYASLLLYCVSYPAHTLSAAASTPVLRWLGTISYGTYLLHAPIRCFFLAAFHELTIRHIPVPGLLITPLALAATLALAQWSWTHYESRFIRWSHTHT